MYALIFSGILFKICTFLISERICGDKCLGEDGNSILCQCGSQNLQQTELENQYLYCCSTTPCNSTNENVHCPNGNFQSFTEPCNMTCPIASISNTIALSTDICPDDQCFDAKDKHHRFNKVCIQTAKSGEDFVKYCGTQTAEICKKNVTTKNEYSQCIVSGSNS